MTPELYPSTERRIKSEQRFKEWSFSGVGTVPNPIAPGILHEFTLPDDLPRRSIWIAGGAFYQNTADKWWMLGCLNFFKGGNKTGCIQFSDAATDCTDADKASAIRLVTQQVSGGLQPPMRYQTTTTLAIDALTMGCFTFVVDANKVEFELEQSFYRIASASALKFLTGLRIVSSK